jgi:protein-tyrosine phosphatase
MAPSIDEQQITPWAWIKAVFHILCRPPFYEPETLPVQLLPWLYLSDEAHSIRMIDKLIDLGITHVLTTNGSRKRDLKLVPDHLKKVGIVHLSIRAHDELGYDMIGKHWEECRSFFMQARDQHQPRQGKVVVHCSAGRNRSGLMAAAAMLTLDDTETDSRRTLLEVVRDLKAKRGNVLTNLSFQKQLCELAAREGRLGEPPAGYNNDPLPVAPPPKPAPENSI